VEPDTFESFFDAIYWSTITLTTVGFGDYTPVTVAGKAVAIVTSFVGIAVFALPTGIITAG
ncbi:MAG: two pore domain potassium channel family protein, partial [Anaerotignum sp.]|nr:two pore domain potassium channel family protein [Anaerotignum sp.]